MKYRLLTLIGLVCIGLAGCGGSPTTNVPASSAPANAPQPTASRAEAAAASAPANAAEPVASSGDSAYSRAYDQLLNAPSFTFRYTSKLTSFGETTRKTAEGARSGARNNPRWFYTVQYPDKPSDPANGEWLMLDNVSYFKRDGTWLKSDLADMNAPKDATATDVALLVEFMPSPTSEQVPELLGSETIEGQTTDHYQGKSMSPVDDNLMDVWINQDTGQIVQIRTPYSKPGDEATLVISKLGEPVNIPSP